MSVFQMAMVWKYQLAHNQQSVLLALADHADDDGTNCYPAIAYVAWKTDYSVRQVRRVVKGLRDIGVLIPLEQHRGQGRPIHYQINLAALPEKGEYLPSRGDTGGKGDKWTPLTNRVIRGDASAPTEDIVMAGGSDTQVSSKPPVTIIQPSDEPSVYGDGLDSIPWVVTLRAIDGWDKKGEAHMDSLLRWIGEKGWTLGQLEASAIGLAATSEKTLKGYRDMAAAYQRRLNQGFDDPRRHADNGRGARGVSATAGGPDSGQGGGWDNRGGQ